MLEESSTSRGKPTMWVCKCDCGKAKIAMGSNLKRQKTRSCGCLASEWAKKLSRLPIKHGLYNTGAYRSYCAMIGRCYNPDFANYHKYGAKGVGVCDRWRNSFENFYADMGARPDGTTLDRFPNPKGDYEPSNCRWSNRKEQNRNRGDYNNRFEFQGKNLTLPAWAEETGISLDALKGRYRQGWDVERMLTTPQKYHRS